jgi:hypothetical protein
MLALTTVEGTDETTAFDTIYTDLETQAQTITDTLAVNIAAETDKARNLMKESEKQIVDATKIPNKFEVDTVIDFLSNEEFMKKTGENIKAEITEVVTKEKKKAEQKVKKMKVDTKKDKVRKQLQIQQDIIDAMKVKVNNLRDERAVAKENFTEVNGFAQVQAIRDAWLTEKEASTSYISLTTKKANVKVINDRLELALQNREIKKTRINLIRARMEKLRLKLSLNDGNKKEIRKRMAKLKRRLAKKQGKVKLINTRIEKF